MAEKIYVLKIPPVGPIEAFPGHDNILDAASTEFGPNGFEVISLGHRLWRKNYMVGAIDEWGSPPYKNLPLNRNGWALYGRSPVFGVMLIGSDNHTPIGKEVLKVLLGEGTDWIGPNLNAAMDDMLRDLNIQQ